MNWSFNLFSLPQIFPMYNLFMYKKENYLSQI